MSRFTIAGLLLILISPFCSASEAMLDQTPIPKDDAAIVRGLEATLSVCGGCHGLKYVRFSHLMALGIPKAKIDEMRGPEPLDSAITHGMDEESAKASFGGAIPPDLSLMANAREGREHYLYSYLTGYHLDPSGNTANSVFKETRMPDVLGIGTAATAADKQRIQEQARDITAFLTWAADPHAAERERVGKYVLTYLAVLTFLLWLWKRQIWRKLDEEPAI